MGKHTIFVNLALTFVWIIFMEAVSWQNIAVGLFISMLCMHFMGKFFNFEEIADVNFYKLASYPFWLLFRIYKDAFFLIKLIVKGAKWDIVTHNLELENPSLRNILADSITLTPGSIYVTRREDSITLLCLEDKKISGYPSGEEGLRTIEKVLSRACLRRPK